MSARAHALLGGLALACAGCLVGTAPLSAPEPEEAARWVDPAEGLGEGDAPPLARFVRARSRGPSPGTSIAGPTRFEIVSTTRRPLSSVPLLGTPRPSGDLGVVLHLDGDRAWSERGPTSIPGKRPIRVRPHCFSDEQEREELVTFESFTVRTSSATSLDYARFIGLTERCAIRALGSIKERVPSLAPGLVYAYQQCRDVACSSVALVLVAPPIEFVATNGPSTTPDRGIMNGSFATVKLPLERGVASAATLNLNGQDLAAWRVTWGEKTPSADEMPMMASRRLSVRVETVWAADDADPEITTHISVDGLPSKNLAALFALTSKD